jgi:tripartite-type tricarboxylate transporter receptor subunit TctC
MVIQQLRRGLEMNKPSRAIALFCLCMIVGFAHAQSWPAKPVKLVVSTGPGLATDIIARILADRLSRALGQQFVVENMAGAGGNIAAQAVARSAPDGYTQLFTGGGVMITNAYAFKSLPFDPVKDFTPVAMITESGGFVLSVNPELPAKTLAELITAAKAQPGRYSYAVDSSNIYAGIIGKLLNKMVGLDIVEIPYKSTPQALQDTVAGRTQIIISAVAPVEAFAKNGKLRRIAVSSAKRMPGLDDLPTMAETIDGFKIDGGGFAVVAPAGTPADIVLRMNRAIAVILRDAEFAKQMFSLGQTAASGASPEGVAEYLRSERERWGRIFKDLAIQPQ